MSDNFKNYITPAGQIKLVDEFNNLSTIERPEILKVISWAAGNGDRSENADYIYGKRRLRQIDSRLRFLKKRLDAAVVVDPTKIKSEDIKFGATVSVIDDDGNEKAYRIVGIDEIELDKNKISWQSPIGRNLLGKEKGDQTRVRTPNGTIELTISNIIYEEIK